VLWDVTTHADMHGWKGIIVHEKSKFSHRAVIAMASQSSS